MRILYFAFVELDVPNACRTHTLGIINGFARQGCRVDALIPRPRQAVSGHPNLRFIWLWPWRFSHIGGTWIRLLSSILMFWLCLRNRYDAIYVRELETHPGPRWCSRFFKTALFIEINDLLVPYFQRTGVRAARVAAVERHQRADFRRAAGLIVNSISMRRWFLDRYPVAPGKFHLVFNGADPPREAPLSREQARNALGIPADGLCLGFLGNIYSRYDFDTLLNACRACRRKIPGLFLLIVGDGPLKQELIRKVADAGLQPQARFTGYVEASKLGRYLPAMDVGLCLGGRDAAAMYGAITTKVATYGMYRLPVLVTGPPEEVYAEGLRRGLFFLAPEDAPALSGLIEQLHLGRSELPARGEEFHAFVRKEMTWDAAAEIIIVALLGCLRDGGGSVGAFRQMPARRLS
jgi:glycosyltransferase involved in cell wall biosynthesis